MKKVLALLLASAMLLCLTACVGGGETPTTTAPKATTPGQTNPQQPSQPPVSDLPGELVQTARWSLRYDPAVWSLEDEDSLSDTDYYSSIELFIPDPAEEGESLVWLEVNAMETDHDNFRSNLRDSGFDMYEYAVNNAYDTVNVGGLEFLVDNSDDDYVLYFMRVFNAGVDVEIEIGGEISHQAVADVLESLVFTIAAGDNVDAPWPWDGAPYAVEPGEETVGAFTLKSTQIPFADCIITEETFDHNIAVVGDLAYVVNDGAVQVYYYDGSKLTFAVDMGLEAEYAIADASVGNVWFSAFMENLLCFDGEKYTAAFEGVDYVSMCPSSPWGVGWFSNNKILKLMFEGAAVTAWEYTLPEVDSISQVCVDASGNIFVCGSSASDDAHRVFVYNENMELQTVLQDEDGSGLGSAVFAAQTGNGFLVLDGNMRDVVLYGADGSYIGSCDFSDLFGTDYPWPCDACVTGDGSILVIMTDERPDESADELIVFKLTGF